MLNQTDGKKASMAQARTPALAPLAQAGLQGYGVGGGQPGGVHVRQGTAGRAGQARAQRTHHATWPPGSGQCLRQPPCSGRFAVGASDGTTTTSRLGWLKNADASMPVAAFRPDKAATSGTPSPGRPDAH